MALHSFLVTNLHGVAPHDLSQKKIYSDGQVRGCFAFQTEIYSNGSLNIYIFLFERLFLYLAIGTVFHPSGIFKMAWKFLQNFMSKDGLIT